MSKIVVCTIIAKNYLALAKSLGQSLHSIHEDVDFRILLIDPFDLPDDLTSLPGRSFLDAPADFLDFKQLNDFISRYDVTEYSTALKGFYLEYLLDQGFEKVIYLDPDILIFQSLDRIFAELDTFNITLIPHILDPIPLDNCVPSEITLLRAGAYNLGFIGIANTGETRRFLDWWKERLLSYCRIDFAEGLFVDQKWIDLVPGLFEGVSILRNRGYDVAYWNLHSRKLEKSEDIYLVDGEPLVFFHFSGFSSDYPDRLSKHQNRLNINDFPILVELHQYYMELLDANGHQTYKNLPYISYISSEFGVNVAGYLKAELGVGEAGRAHVSALNKLEIPISLVDFGIGTQSRKHDSTLGNLFANHNPYPINLVCVNADQVPQFLNYVGPHYFQNKYNIGAWWWELPDFPEEWRDLFELFNEIWVGSNFVYESISQYSPVPVNKIPPVVDVKLNSESVNFGFIQPENFTFLFIFDFFSIFERKNPVAVIDAFKKAFQANEPVKLILKCINADRDPEHFKILQELSQGSGIIIIDKYLSKDEKNHLINACDCYISLHRSEGFGLTLAEAMFLEKPVIATGWSGNTDFMTVNNSYLVEYNLVELQQDYGPYKKGQVWADPNIEHAAGLMRYVYEHKDEASRKAKYAASDIRLNYSPEALACAIQERINVIKNKFDEAVSDIAKQDIAKQEVVEDAGLDFQLKQLEDEILAMKTSKFWKIRERWFKVKNVLGLPSKIF